MKGALYEWQRRPGREDNHWFDTCVMNFALADFLKIRTMGPGGGAKRPAAKNDGTAGKWAQGAGAKTSNWKDV